MVEEPRVKLGSLRRVNSCQAVYIRCQCYDLHGWLPYWIIIWSLLVKMWPWDCTGLQQNYSYQRVESEMWMQLDLKFPSSMVVVNLYSLYKVLRVLWVSQFQHARGKVFAEMCTFSFAIPPQRDFSSRARDSLFSTGRWPQKQSTSWGWVKITYR